MNKIFFVAFLFLFLELQPYAIARYIRNTYSHEKHLGCVLLYDFDYSYGNNLDYEVYYVSPEKYQSLIDYLTRFSTTLRPSITYVTEKSTEEPSTKAIEETTTAYPRYTEEITTFSTRPETSPTTSTESMTTLKERVSEEVEGPIEDVIFNEPVKKESITSTTTVEVPLEPSPEEMDEFDDEFERDSEEDILSIKKPQKIEEPITPEDENNSKPKDIYRWF